jgi:hypothetical protein
VFFATLLLILGHFIPTRRKMKNIFKSMVPILGVILLSIPSLNAQTTEIWDLQETGTQQDLFEIKALDSVLVVPGTGGLVLIRKQPSNPWESISFPNPVPVVSIETIAFQGNNSRHIALQSDGKVYRLTGPSWMPIPDSLPALPATDLVCKKLLHLNLSGANEIRYGIVCDSGRMLGYKAPWPNPRFEIQLSTQKEIQDLFPFNTWNLLAVGDSGKIWKTVGLADPFVPIAQNLTRVRLNKVFKGHGSHLWIAGDSGILLKSTNLGNSWSLRQLPTNAQLRSGCMEDSLLWVCGDAGEIWKSTDQGINWETVSGGTTQNLHDVRNLNGQVWIAGASGTLLKLRRVTAVRTSAGVQGRTRLAAGRLWWKNPGDEPISILGTDPMGRKAFHLQIDPHQENSIPIPGNGLWMIRLRSGNAQFTEKWHFHKE